MFLEIFWCVVFPVFVTHLIIEFVSLIRNIFNTVTSFEYPFFGRILAYDYDSDDDSSSTNSDCCKDCSTRYRDYATCANSNCSCYSEYFDNPEPLCGLSRFEIEKKIDEFVQNTKFTENVVKSKQFRIFYEFLGRDDPINSDAIAKVWRIATLRYFNTFMELYNVLPRHYDCVKKDKVLTWHDFDYVLKNNYDNVFVERKPNLHTSFILEGVACHGKTTCLSNLESKYSIPLYSQDYFEAITRDPKFAKNSFYTMKKALEYETDRTFTLSDRTIFSSYIYNFIREHDDIGVREIEKFLNDIPEEFTPIFESLNVVILLSGTSYNNILNKMKKRANNIDEMTIDYVYHQNLLFGAFASKYKLPIMYVEDLNLSSAAIEKYFKSWYFP